MGVKDSFLGRLLGNADKYSDEQISQTITLLVENGVKHQATDIHIEPAERTAIVRYRIDGVLHQKHKLPLAALPAIIAEVKDMASMRTSDQLLPQEGYYATLVGEDQFEVHVHSMPIVGGEKLTLHLMRRLATPPTLVQLGFWGQGLEHLQTALSRAHGLIIVGAPRRSGVTTTLHSMLQTVSSPSLSIATIENSFEYRLQGASQTIVRPHRGITFKQGLQAALNQDPNIVMISSLPDHGTAETAVQAAIGGHMVIAAVHTNNAATAIAHIRALGDEPFLLSTTLRIAISQRLVRALCSHCRIRVTPSAEEITEIEKSFGLMTAPARRLLHQLEQQAADAGIDHSKQANTTPTHIAALWQASDEGCEACGHTGYRGSIALTEVLSNSETVQKAILTHHTAKDIHQAALKGGFIPMELDGLVKALRGQTTITEVLRVFSS
jgi:type II secretory ATPase GspE/PulE/Tfp pilus assembly ATPase PilB-like protein